MFQLRLLKQQMLRFSFIQVDNLYLFVGIFSPFIFIVILTYLDSCLFSFYSFCFFFASFVSSLAICFFFFPFVPLARL